MTLDDMEFKLLLDMEKNSEHRLFLCVYICTKSLFAQRMSYEIVISFNKVTSVFSRLSIMSESSRLHWLNVSCFSTEAANGHFSFPNSLPAYKIIVTNLFQCLMCCHLSANWAVIA